MWNLYGLKGEGTRRLVATFDSEQQLLAYVSYATLKHEPSVARIHNNIGAVYRQQGKLDKALEHYEKALAIDRRMADQAAVATRMANIGTVYMDRGDYERAREHYELSLAAARKSGCAAARSASASRSRARRSSSTRRTRRSDTPGCTTPIHNSGSRT